MLLKWTYLLIAIIYSVLGVLYFLDLEMGKRFKAKYPETKSYKARRKDFFSFVAAISIVVTLLINTLTLIGGNGLHLTTVGITLLVIGMALIVEHITVHISDTCIQLVGFEIPTSNLKGFEQIQKKNTVKNRIIFEKPINGYEGIEFLTKVNVSNELKEGIKIPVND